MNVADKINVAIKQNICVIGLSVSPWYRCTCVLTNVSNKHPSDDDDMKWVLFQHGWRFVRGIHRSLTDCHVNEPEVRGFGVFFFDVSRNKLLKCIRIIGDHGVKLCSSITACLRTIKGFTQSFDVYWKIRVLREVFGVILINKTPWSDELHKGGMICS